MRALLISYLVAYYALLTGAIVTAWRSGLIEYLDRGWTIAAIGAAILLGAVLALVSGHAAPATSLDGRGE